jgi:hypothetical protein
MHFHWELIATLYNNSIKRLLTAISAQYAQNYAGTPGIPATPDNR